MQETWVQSLVRKIPWRREWLPTPVFLPGESHGQRSLAGYSPSGHKESDTTEQLTLSVWRQCTWSADTVSVRGFALEHNFPSLNFHALEKAMATHSSVLAWRIPGTAEPMGCHLWGRTESDTTEATWQQQQQQPTVAEKTPVLRARDKGLLPIFATGQFFFFFFTIGKSLNMYFSLQLYKTRDLFFF